MNFEKHVFICTRCTYQDQPAESAAEFRKRVKLQVKQKIPEASIRVNASGCLGQCERGISCVIYPEGKWLTELSPQDEEKILENLK